MKAVFIAGALLFVSKQLNRWRSRLVRLFLILKSLDELVDQNLFLGRTLFQLKSLYYLYFQAK